MAIIKLTLFFAIAALGALASAKAEVSSSPNPMPLDKGLTQISPDFENLPTFISSNSLTLNSKVREFEYTGKVEVKHGDMTITSDTLVGQYDENNQILNLIAKVNVVILKGENIRGTGQKAVYDKKSDTVTLTESPQIEQNGSVLTADLIRVFLKDDRSVAEGDVRVKVVKADPVKAAGPAPAAPSETSQGKLP